MIFNATHLFFLFIFIVISIILIISFVYCCAYESTFGRVRRQKTKHYELSSITNPTPTET